jgi:hypothetical protein
MFEDLKDDTYLLKYVAHFTQTSEGIYVMCLIIYIPLSEEIEWEAMDWILLGPLA